MSSLGPQYLQTSEGYQYIPATQLAAQSAVKVMVTGDTIFTIAGGPIQIRGLQSVCISANGATASTLQYQSAPTVGSATTISGASASLANATAGTTVTANETALSTAPDVVAASSGGVILGANVANMITVQPGTLKIVIGVGSTTGTWQHFISFIPLSPTVTVS